MAILARPGIVIPPVIPQELNPYLPKQVVWTASDGVTSINLTNRPGGYFTLTGRQGFGPVDALMTTDTMWDGSGLVRNTRAQPRLMTVPLMIEGKPVTGLDYLTLYRALTATFRHPVNSTTDLPTPGRITVSLPDGTTRSIAAYYQGGGSPVEDTFDDTAIGWSMLPNLQFLAPVPTWEGDTQVQTWELAPDDGGVPPMPPVLLGSTTLLGTTTFQNLGDSDAYPVWTITGPGTPTITNTDTGDSIAFTEAIDDGDTVVVDCRPVSIAPATGLTATQQDDTDWWPMLQDFPDLFTLPPGLSHLDLAMASSGPDSSITLSVTTRWQGAW